MAQNRNVFTLSTITPGVRALFELLPDNLIERLIDRGERANDDKFATALDTLEIVKLVKSGKFSTLKKYAEKYPDGGRPPVSVMDVYEFMSLATKSQGSPRTIRYWSDVIKKYDTEDRETLQRFGDVLPFDHFAVASHSDNPVEALELAMAQTVANNGIPPTADWLAQKMNRTTAQPDLPDYPPDYVSTDLLDDRTREWLYPDGDPRNHPDHPQGRCELVPVEPTEDEPGDRWGRLYEGLNIIRRYCERIADQLARGMYRDPDQVQDRLRVILSELENLEKETDSHV